MIVSPSFSTIQSSFGRKVKDAFNYEVFSDEIDLITGESPRKLIKSILNNDLAKLQNLGHVEVDIISTDSTSNEVKRGIVTPRLIASLVNLPKDITPSRIARKFSKETGQAETRIIVRKRFTSSKLVLEMLIESGFMVGKVESTVENALKAPLEAAFIAGKGLSAQIRSNPTFLADLETSKSIKEYITISTVNAIKGITIPEYSSKTSINNKTKISVPKVEIVLKSTTTSARTRKIPKPKKKIEIIYSTTSLEAILRTKLAAQIKSNMGTGNAKNVLNYRTGRFAESATIERTTTSRAGMVSVFYNYMRNPYGTFSEGGRQQYPKSRDPKLLISKSIREIGAQLVGNRMRAILV